MKSGVKSCVKAIGNKSRMPAGKSYWKSLGAARMRSETVPKTFLVLITSTRN